MMIKLTTIRGDEILVNPESVRDYGTYRLVVSLGQEYKVDESLQKIERMMLRDQFAMSAMNGVMSMAGLEAYVDCVKDAYFIADAMLEERGK